MSLYLYVLLIRLNEIPSQDWYFSFKKPSMKTTEKRFFLDKNDITIKCINTVSGDKGFVDGIEYECVDNELLRERIKEGSDVTRLSTTLVTDMYELFKDSNFNQPIGNWDVSNVTDMGSMFSQSKFNQSICSWDVNNVTDMNFMFYGSSFNQPIEEWDVNNVLEMSGMYWNSQFNQPIGDWNLNSMIEMRYMFINSQFNQNISDWCVNNIVKEPREFSSRSPLSEQNKPQWGIIPD